MKQINEIKRMQRIAGIITENEYQKAMMINKKQYYVYDIEGMEPPVGPFSLEKASATLLQYGNGWRIIDAETAKEIWSWD